MNTPQDPPLNRDAYRAPAKEATHWDQLQTLFHQAEAIADSDLDVFLANACTDSALRTRAARLIRASRIIPDAPPSATIPFISDRIGPYAILRHIGSGGIGAVYLVERLVGGTVQRAALKVLSLHASGPFFTDRFAREQHILASLDHPNITRMLDAGLTESGQPYLVMEYVDGVHLDVYCDDHALSIPERLQLFLRVCEAVAYAHRNLIVHLDLKPSNILVAESEGTVKLLDFGTSKLIQPDSLLTTTVLATPAYASPEQLRNEAVTTACDVYTLGAILFELLAGRRPNLDTSVAVMIERSIKETPPEHLPDALTEAAAERRGLSLSRLRTLLSGDLATIAAKCLSPRAQDRYASVESLMIDVQHYLAGRPILARPQTTTYRLSKFVRRNRKSVLASTVAIFLIVSLSGYALWRQEQALREGRRALQMQTFMSQLFRIANSNYMGKPAATVPEFLELGVKVLPDFIKDPKDERAAQLSLSESMFDNGDLAHAEVVFQQIAASAQTAGDAGLEAEANAFAGKCAYVLGRGDLGAALFAHALSLVHRPGVGASARVRTEVMYAENTADRGLRSDANGALLKAAAIESQSAHLPERDQAWAFGVFADYLSQTGDLDQADRWATQSKEIYDLEPYAVCDQAKSATLLATIRYNRPDYQGALPFFRQGYEGLKTCMGAEHADTLGAQVLLARDMLKVDDAKEVIPMLEAALPLWRKAFPNGTDIGAPLIFLTRAYMAMRQYLQAEATVREALRVQTGKVDPHSTRVAVCELLWAQALEGEGRDSEALHHAESANTDYAGIGVMTPAEKVYASQALALETKLQAKLRQ